MNKLYFFLTLLLIFGCKKAPLADTNCSERKTIKPTLRLKPEGNAQKIDSLSLIPFESKTLEEFYQSTGFETVWQSEKYRKVILDKLNNCEEEGLNPSDYNVKALNDFEKKITSLNEIEITNYDILLTYEFQKYLTHLSKGKLNPKNLYTNWDLVENNFDVNTRIFEGFTNKSIEELIEKTKPSSFTYKKLIKALKLINEFPDDHLNKIIANDKITLNDTNNSLKQIKKRLRYWNDLAGKDSLNNVYNKKTFSAIKRFQNRHGLVSDGVIGAGTIAALNFSKTQRKEQIIANLERWRWFNQDYSKNYVIINIPNYSLNVVEDKDSTVYRKIVVGTIKRKTPVLTSTLKSVVFNPTWTVPPTILKEDIVPEMKKNRNYLRNKNITIYDSNNKEVAPNKWNINKPNSYRYVQSPSRNNSLGEIKILFPNHHSVYLHDTNHRNLFGMHNRSLSSGCVRVENPLDLAQHLLNDSLNWSRKKIDSVVLTKETKNIRITKKYAIYLWYWTAWSENNKLIFRYDVYNLDAELYRKLRS
jgi:murein L,D-transpeptidase YcbB/YkuD